MDTCIACGYALVDGHEACPECGLPAALQAACGDVQFESPDIQRRVIRAHSAYVLATTFSMISLLLLMFATRGIGSDFGCVEGLARLAMIFLTLYSAWQSTKAPLFRFAGARPGRRTLRSLAFFAVGTHIGIHAGVYVALIDPLPTFEWIYPLILLSRWSILGCLAVPWLCLRRLVNAGRYPAQGRRIRMFLGVAMLVLAAGCDALMLHWLINTTAWNLPDPTVIVTIGTFCMVVALPIFAWRTNPLPKSYRATLTNRQRR